MNFKDFKFKSQLDYAISRAGFREPSPIQEKTIPLILEGRDVVGQANTGTGKTAAFALPLLEKTNGSIADIVVIVPTRELASQVADEFYRFSRHLQIRTAAVYGGTSYRRQIEHINRSGVIVATPGRFLDLLERKKIDIHPRFLVLDEADEMLNMGFLEDIRRILSYFEDREQTLMFSATMSPDIKELTETILKKPVFIRTEQEAVTNNRNIKQYYYVVDEHERDDAMVRLIEFADPKKAIVFCRTKKETDRLAEYLSSQGYRAEALHGDMDQWDRQKTMKAFRRNEYEILVATDVASRGLDVRGISHIFNYHIPFESESYVHRIGRTGRAHRYGVAMMLVSPHELRELQRIQKDVGSELILKTIPRKSISFQKKQDFFSQLAKETRFHKGSEQILDLLLKDHSLRELSLKLIAHIEKSLKEDSSLGKSIREVEEMLMEASSPEKREVVRSHSPQRRRYKNIPMKRGTGRGEVPQPSLKKIGSSRIIARKLFK